MFHQGNVLFCREQKSFYKESYHARKIFKPEGSQLSIPILLPICITDEPIPHALHHTMCITLDQH